MKCKNKCLKLLIYYRILLIVKKFLFFKKSFYFLKSSFYFSVLEKIREGIEKVRLIQNSLFRPTEQCTESDTFLVVRPIGRRGSGFLKQTKPLFIFLYYLYFKLFIIFWYKTHSFKTTLVMFTAHIFAHSTQVFIIIIASSLHSHRICFLSSLLSSSIFSIGIFSSSTTSKLSANQTPKRPFAS